VKRLIFVFFSITVFFQGSFSQSINHWESLVNANDTWKYTIPSAELPANWTNSDFNDSAWSSGKGGVGYGDNDDSTIIPDGTLSVFMRISFDLIDSSNFTSAFLYVDYDDGFVAYLNGTEIARANIGSVGIRPAFNATAILRVEPAAATGAIPLSFPVDNKILLSSLKKGTNILALQFHNQDVSSSDLSSTTYFFGGFNNSSIDFRPTPSWFIPPPEVTSHLPIVVIDTWGGNIQDTIKTDAWIKVINNGYGKINNINDPGTDFEGNIGIEIRGQSSKQFPKLGYGVETRNQLKVDTAVSLLGMPAESDWILSAPYSDKTLMRNPLTYFLGNSMGRWQPHTQWCELYLNGDYRGLYFLVEKIKRDKNRVNIDKLLPADLTADLLTGGYILKVDKVQDITANEHFLTYPSKYPNTRNYDFTYVYPKWDEIMPEQKVYIKDFLTGFETALNGTNFKDPIKGFRSYLDENSFVDFQIIQELANNVDGYRFSTFFHKENNTDGGKLVAGPLWDFDLCYGNVDYSPLNLATNQWLYTTYGPGEWSPMHWWARLMQDPFYKALVKKRYSELRNGSLSIDSIYAFLDNNQSLLGEAINRNFVRWPILNQYVWPNYYIGNTYDNEMDYLKTWLLNRLTWMDSQWLIPLNALTPASLANTVLVYPNPFYQTINLSFTPKSLDEIVVDIYTIQGQKVLSRKFQIFSITNTEIIIENVNLMTGIYFLQAHQCGNLIGYSKLVRTSEN
jgi:hypothetical protein